jgi:D-alanine-D-alanine ligase
MPHSILILGGGPDSEHEVSLKSAHFITLALREAGYTVHNQTIDRLSADDLKRLPGEVIFPALHGGWGEGGPLQDILEADGRPFVGCMSQAARHAMDKIASKFTARTVGLPTPEVRLLDLRDTVCPLPFPVIIKPVHEGSTVGLFVCNNAHDWEVARRTIDEQRFGSGSERVYMIEPCINRLPLAPGRPARKARELTVGYFDGQALPPIEITPADGLYDYEAKYTRNDTIYTVAPELPRGITEKIQQQTVALAKAMNVRHLARADFMLDADNDSPNPTAWFLEINTLPGFTDHSLFPMAAKHISMPMPVICSRLVECAIRDHR